MTQAKDQTLEHLRGKLREHMNTYADNISTNKCTDWAEYQNQCGIIEGLALAERELLDIDEMQYTGDD